MEQESQLPQNPSPFSRMPNVVQRPKTVLVPGSEAGIEVGSYPVAKNCMVRLTATALLTAEAVKALIKQLQLGVDLGIYPDDDPASGSDQAQ